MLLLHLLLLLVSVSMTRLSPMRMPVRNWSRGRGGTVTMARLASVRVSVPSSSSSVRSGVLCLQFAATFLQQL